MNDRAERVSVRGYANLPAAEVERRFGAQLDALAASGAEFHVCVGASKDAMLGALLARVPAPRIKVFLYAATADEHLALFQRMAALGVRVEQHAQWRAAEGACEQRACATADAHLGLGQDGQNTVLIRASRPALPERTAAFFSISL